MKTLFADFAFIKLSRRPLLSAAHLLISSSSLLITSGFPNFGFDRGSVIEISRQYSFLNLYRLDKQYSPISAIASLYYLFDTIGI
jgi:hypothetical protein